MNGIMGEWLAKTYTYKFMFQVPIRSYDNIIDRILYAVIYIL